MAIAFLGLSLVLWFALLLGLIKPSVVIRWGEKKTRLRVLAVYGFLFSFFFLLFVIAVVNEEPNQEVEKKTVQVTKQKEAETYDFFSSDEKGGEPSREKSAEEKAREQKTDFLEFEVQVMRIIKKVEKKTKIVRRAIKAYEQGQLHAIVLYEAAKAAKDANNQAIFTIMKIDIPKDLPGEVEKGLADARDSFELCVTYKKKAYSAFMEYLDEQKPSQASEVNENTKESRYHKAAGKSQLMAQRAKLGLPSPGALKASPEFKAWRAFEDDYLDLLKQAREKFGEHPHEAFWPGDTLKIAKPVRVVPIFDLGKKEPGFDGRGLIKKAMDIQPGESVKIVKRFCDKRAYVEQYRVTLPEHGGASAYLSAGNLYWYDTSDRLNAHLKKMEAWRLPKYKALVEKHYQSKGFDEYKIEGRAGDERWNWTVEIYGK